MRGKALYSIQVVDEGRESPPRITRLGENKIGDKTAGFKGVMSSQPLLNIGAMTRTTMSIGDQDVTLSAGNAQDESVITIVFSLKGRSQVQSSDGYGPFSLNSSQGIILGASDHSFTFTFKANVETESVGFIIGPEIRRKVFAERSYKGDSGFFARDHFDESFIIPVSISPKLRRIVDDIENRTFTGGARQLFLEAKGLETFAEVADIICDPEPMEKEGLGENVKRSIAEAREILLSNIFNPPSTLTLANDVGLEYKSLANGFKEVYGSTPSAFIRNHRLDLAREELRRKKLTVAEVARKLGYSHTSHFIRAFRARFGVTPGKEF